MVDDRSPEAIEQERRIDKFFAELLGDDNANDTEE
jgi:hypothetical protein